MLALFQFVVYFKCLPYCAWCGLPVPQSSFVKFFLCDGFIFDIGLFIFFCSISASSVLLCCIQKLLDLVKTYLVNVLCILRFCVLL